MPIDMRRPLIAAIEAALDEVRGDPPKKQRRHGGAGRALLIGAGVVTAGRFVVSGRGRGMLESIQQRLPDQGQGHPDDDEVDAEGDEDFDDDEELEDAEEEPEDAGDEDAEEEPEDAGDEDVEEEPEEDLDDEPEDEADDEPEDEADEEPEDQADEDVDQAPADEEPEDEQPADEDEDNTPRRRTRGRTATRSRR